ncbi:P68 family surface lipoprotein [Mycoplasmopsis synoviae]|uniref:P68 family surface lipoprotein n=1 Tax=Mycoplasmopsis synoviae TaxID=2109 RepID=UPI00387AD40F
MNKTKIKFILGTLGSIAALSISASCGSSNGSINESNNNIGGVTDNSSIKDRRLNALLGANPEASSNAFQQVEKDKIVLAMTFSQGGAQAKALNELVNAYNNDAELKAKLGNIFKEVTVNNVGSGYGEGAKKVSQYLEAKNTDNFFNLILNYSPVGVILANSNMLLSFNDPNGNPDLDTDISLFNKDFVNSNATTENIKNPSTYILPIMKSTLVSTINAPVMSYILDTMKAKGVTFSDDVDTKNFVAEIDSKGQPDRSQIQKQWGDPVDNATELLKGFQFSKKIFNNYEDLIKFAELAQKLFKNTQDNQNDLHVLGIDSPTSTFQNSVYSLTGYRYANSLEATSKKNGVNTVNYNSLTTTGSPANVAAKTVYETFRSAVATQGVVLQGPGQFTSNKQIYHKFAMSIGSTAGYTHNYIESVEGTINFNFSQYSGFNFKASTNKSDRNNYNKSGFLTFGLGLNGLGRKYRTNYTSDQIFLGFGSFKNGLAKSNVTLKSRFDIKSIDTTNDASIQAAIDKIKNDTSNWKLLLLQQSDSSKTQEFTDFQTVVKNAASQNSSEIIYGGVAESSNSKNPQKSLVVFVKSSNSNPVKADWEKYIKLLGGTAEEQTSSNTLNKNELVVINAPTKWNENSAKNSIYLQGPSLIGIKANEVDDAATRAFVHWLVTSKKEYTFFKDDSKSTVTATPSLFFQKQMSYVMPTSDFQNSVSDKTFDSGKNSRTDNPFLENALQVFKNAAKDQANWTTYESPGSEKGDAFRNSVESAFKNLINQAANGTQVSQLQTFDQFVQSFRDTFGSNNN